MEAIWFAGDLEPQRPLRQDLDAAAEPWHIHGTVVNEIQPMALSKDGLDHASLLPLCRIPDRDAGQLRLRVSHSAPTPDYLTRATSVRQ